MKIKKTDLETKMNWSTQLTTFSPKRAVQSMLDDTPKKVAIIDLKMAKKRLVYLIVKEKLNDLKLESVLNLKICVAFFFLQKK